MFFNTAFDVTLSVILGILAVLLLTGHGDFVLIKMRSRADREKPLSYDKKKLSITMGVLCLVMLAAELIMIFFADEFLAAVIAMALVILAFVIGVIYLRKFAKVLPGEEEPVVKKEKSIRDRINELERKNR